MTGIGTDSPRDLEEFIKDSRRRLVALERRRGGGGGGGATQLIPVGTIMPFGGSSVPLGWLTCDGSAVSRTTYAALFATIGTTYGAGDGSTTFTLPNLKGRVPVGQDTAQTEFDAMGETGGAKTHTLTVEQMPSHTHPITQPGTIGGSTDKIWGDYNGAAGTESGATATARTNVAGFSNALGTTAVGGDGPHNNLQPYQVVRYIISTSTQSGGPVDPAQLPPRLGPDAATLGTTDLNTLFDSGWYVQTSNSNATLARNYPDDQRAGELEVVGYVAGTDFALQRYTEYIPRGGTGAPRVWHRSHYNGTWYPWKLIGITSGGTLSASTPPSSYELGYTFGDADTSFPTNLATVEVVKHGDIRTVQRVNEKSGWQRLWHRSAVDAATWGPWILDGGDSDWKPLTTQNAWVWASASAGYRVRGDTCYLRGEFFGGANQTVVFNLPAEARPNQRTTIVVARYATTSTPAFGSLAINTTGDCTFNLLGGTIPTASPGLTLLGFSYLLD